MSFNVGPITSIGLIKPEVVSEWIMATCVAFYKYSLWNSKAWCTICIFKDHF